MFNSLMISTFSLLGLSAKQSSRSINIWLVLACYPTYDRLISSCRQILLHDAKVAQWDFPWVTRGIFPGSRVGFPLGHTSKETTAKMSGIFSASPFLPLHQSADEFLSKLGNSNILQEGYFSRSQLRQRWQSSYRRLLTQDFRIRRNRH